MESQVKWHEALWRTQSTGYASSRHLDTHLKQTPAQLVGSVVFTAQLARWHGGSSTVVLCVDSLNMADAYLM